MAFGTAGIRGLLGLGPGRLNAFTVRKVAAGLAKYLNEHKPGSKVVIHFDTRFYQKNSHTKLQLYCLNMICMQ